MLATGLSSSSAALGAGFLAGFDGNPPLAPRARMPARPCSGISPGRFPPFSPTFPGGTRAEVDFRQTIQETPFPLAGRRLAGSVEARLPSVGSVLARSDLVRGRGLGSAPGASASSARMFGRCPKGALLQRRRNSLKFGLAQWEGSGIILTCALKRTVFLGSSTAEHPAVNRRVVGSNPTRGAI